MNFKNTLTYSELQVSFSLDLWFASNRNRPRPRRANVIFMGGCQGGKRTDWKDMEPDRERTRTLQLQRVREATTGKSGDQSLPVLFIALLNKQFEFPVGSV